MHLYFTIASGRCNEDDYSFKSFQLVSKQSNPTPIPSGYVTELNIMLRKKQTDVIRRARVIYYTRNESITVRYKAIVVIGGSVIVGGRKCVRAYMCNGSLASPL